MYTVVMMMALTTGGDSPAFFNRGCNGCNGCWGCYDSCHGCNGCWSSCHGCNGCYDSCHGRRGLFGRKGCNSCRGGLFSGLFSRKGCHGCSSSCHGCSGCNGCWSSCHGCHGGYSCHGCAVSCHGCAVSCHGCAVSCHGCYVGCGGCAISCGGCAISCHGCMGCAGCVGCHGAVVVPAAPPAEKAPEKTSDKPMGMGAAPATILVRVPAMAKLTVDGTATTQTSARRLFTTPELAQGRTYTYEFEAEFTHEGKTVTLTREVIVRAGQQSEVEFNVPTASNVAGR